MTTNSLGPAGKRHHVVIIGGGFGGLFAAKKFKGKDIAVTIIDRTNHHLFQPLLYQVATGILSEGEIAPSIRQLMADDENIRVIKGEVRNIDIDGQNVTADLGGKEAVIEYDSLILAAGAAQSYFGNDHFAEFAPGMKSVDDALEIRARVTGAFERAEITTDPEERRRLLNFVVVGAGPTGVELAGQLAEMAHRTLAKEFREVDTNDARIILIDGGPQVLPPFGKRLGRKARRKLEDLGVEVVLNSLVTNVDREGVTYKNMKTGEESSIPSYAKIWSAGVAASPLGKHVADQAGVESDRAGRVMVNEDLTLGEHKNVFLIGDMINLNGLPGVAQVAMQGGQYAAKTIIDEIENGTSPEARAPFDYFDKGSMAIVSRFNAVVKINKAEVSGFIGWLMWLALHLLYLVGFRNRAIAAFSWGLNSVSRRRWQLVATRQQLHARNALNKLRKLEDEKGIRSLEVRDNLKFGEGRDTPADAD
ncbi:MULTISPECIES: NAD(P)/FAD-dependent oxidoreductase [Corynebacterium]|uniref:NADH:ubiquinone reductase (non-electrogenic) n=2 Tax=Corynebacterium urealyticum TaxID=43771 RepID=B1VGY2_CORU7|nr:MULTISPECIES: NAD(P)/FAD-dependent oxidoreductase [Corynebacterium]AGE36638.1 NADH dehydrogenase [Corynebacterium urealyticum DSM 7111]MDK8790159.1 NAD(P)/FAD-dependent oxidoreductase [Corynebacterium sp. MSK039]OFO12591.1 NADH dehydrogenase [Corynebacterium sp. HMSC22B11]OFS18579.1 NADH dehydrogenase [Corynebacterium sp. HMSC27B11]PZO97639.1 MAG: NAD(P)/FAD-dependent oxidoreductase [Corynebacterium urealyticum]